MLKIKPINCQQLSISCLNVCGIKKKLQNPDFVDLMTINDICICLEMKLDDLDVLQLPDQYAYFVQTGQNGEGWIVIKNS